MAYADLLADVADRLDRDDLATRLPRWIKDVEARLNRLLQDPEMDVVSESVASGEYTALPADFGEMVSISTGDGRLQPIGAVEFATFDTSITGTPRYYTVQNGSIGFYPGNATASIRMVYRRTIPALTEAAPTNWLLERAPDVYKLGVLYHAAQWDHDRETASDYKALWDEAISELRTDGARRKYGAGTLAPRIRRA